MALARKCDRCKKYFDPDKNERISKIKVGEYKIEDNDGLFPPIDSFHYFDLCNTCHDSLIHWLKDYNESKEEHLKD